MKVYVGGSSRNMDRTRKVQEMVRRAGHAITFDWTGPEGMVITDGTWPQHAQKGHEVSHREIAAVRNSDLVIILAEPTGGLGMWIELGAALAAGKQTWVCGERVRDSVFWQHSLVQRLTDSEALTAIRLGWEAK